MANKYFTNRLPVCRTAMWNNGTRAMEQDEERSDLPPRAGRVIY